MRETLPCDICRCRDETCQVRNTCQRFIDRSKVPAGGIYLTIAESLLSTFRWNEDGEPVYKSPEEIELERSRGCKYFIPEEN